MKEKLPINCSILKWARISVGLSIRDVALKFYQKSKKHSDAEVIEKWEKAIIGWESGKVSPTYSQLEKLADKIYKRPVAVFFFPDIPYEETPQTDFRTLPDTIIAQLPFGIIKLYRKAKVYQLNLDELFEGNKPISPNLIDDYSLENNNDIASIASEIRRQLGVSIKEQFSWQEPDAAFKNWRKAFEGKGIFIFKDAFRNDDYSGFCIHNDKYPIIFVNNSRQHPHRQIFTLFHELGHLLYHTGGIEFRNIDITKSLSEDYKIIEINCNKFANELLVPAGVFDQLTLEVSEQRFEQLADQFSVSREVILRNYLERNLIDQSYYKKMVDKWAREPRKQPSEGGNYHYNKRVYLGETYTNLALSKYYQKKITIENLSEYLGIKVDKIPNFEHECVFV